MSQAEFGINTNILETNLINILLLIGLLIVSFADSAQTALKDREKKISSNFEMAANRIYLANSRYKEALESLEKIRTKSIDLQKEKVEELRQTKTLIFDKFQPFVIEEVNALKTLVLGQYRSFDKQLVNGIFRFYQKHENY